jgi:predicted  nucleic acid-binding Zn-ribbon protein
MVGLKDDQISAGGRKMEKEHVKILLEDIKEKFELVLEGHQSLRHDIKDLRQDMNEKFELVDFKIDALSTKIDNVAADLAAHRADTESHPKEYKVSDGK